MNLNKLYKNEIIICENCKGYGKIERSELEDYHNNISNYWDEICNYCNGNGRLIVESENMTLENKTIKRNIQITVRALTSEELRIRKKDEINKAKINLRD